MMSYTIEVSEPVYNLLNQQAYTQNSSLDKVLEHLLTAAPFIWPETANLTEKETLQQEIIKLYSTDLEYQELLGLKQILADFFAHKAIDEADKIWDEEND
ncbi:MAG: hypothetical protein R2911_13755 [Caldilineaceae bacterium]